MLAGLRAPAQNDPRATVQEQSMELRKSRGLLMLSRTATERHMPNLDMVKPIQTRELAISV